MTNTKFIQRAIPVVVVVFASEGNLVGLIQDTMGGALSAARVTAMNEETGIRQSAATDREGAYEIAALRAGKYKVIVRHPAYRAATARE